MYGSQMVRVGFMEEMCSNEVKGGGKNKVITTAAFILFSTDSHV